MTISLATLITPIVTLVIGGVIGWYFGQKATAALEAELNSLEAAVKADASKVGL